MRTTETRRCWFDVLRPGSVPIFVGLMLVALAMSWAPRWESFTGRTAARLAGYAGCLALLVPYLHVLRRLFCHRLGQPLSRWLRWHVAAAYLGLLMTLVHAGGRTNGPLTQAIVWLLWIVMVSGVIGFFGQKVLYVLLPHLVTREYGLERLEPQRLSVCAAAEELLARAEFRAGALVVRLFGDTALRDCLAQPFAFWRGWFGSVFGEVLSENGYQRSLNFADPQQAEVLKSLRELIRLRQEMDLEYRLHQLGRIWLLVHGPAAWALLVLMLEHVALSLWYGGF